MNEFLINADFAHFEETHLKDFHPTVGVKYLYILHRETHGLKPNLGYISLVNSDILNV